VATGVSSAGLVDGELVGTDVERGDAEGFTEAAGADEVAAIEADVEFGAVVGVATMGGFVGAGVATAATGGLGCGDALEATVGVDVAVVEGVVAGLEVDITGVDAGWAGEEEAVVGIAGFVETAGIAVVDFGGEITLGGEVEFLGFGKEITGISLRCSIHQPAPAEIKISPINKGKILRRRRVGIIGVPRCGVSPKRRVFSDFFKASNINDIRYSRLCAKCGPSASTAVKAKKVSGPTIPSAVIP